MKKIFSVMLLIATIFMALPGCSDEENENNEPNGIIQDNITGTWEGTAVKIEGKWIDISNSANTLHWAFTATFNDDGTYNGTGTFGNGNGTYKIFGRVIETYVDGKLFLKYEVRGITNDTAEFTIVKDNSTVDVRVIRLYQID